MSGYPAIGEPAVTAAAMRAAAGLVEESGLAGLSVRSRHAGRPAASR